MSMGPTLETSPMHQNLVKSYVNSQMHSISKSKPFESPSELTRMTQSPEGSAAAKFGGVESLRLDELSEIWKKGQSARRQNLTFKKDAARKVGKINRELASL